MDGYFKNLAVILERIEMKLDCMVAANGHPDLARWFTHVNINHTLPPEVIETKPRDHNAPPPKRPDLWRDPARVKTDEDGYNQWGSKYSSVCKNCNSAFPTNMYGMGQCQACGHDHNPLVK